MDDVARVVLAVDAPEVAEEVLHYLDRSGLARVVATAVDDRQLAEAVRQTEPDLVVVQPSLASAARGVAVVVVDGRESVGGLRSALDAGAQGFFVWPGDRERLLGTVARSNGGRAAAGPRGLVVAVRAARGGAGATFVSTHLAAAVARSGASCIVVDGDQVADDLRSAVGAPPEGLHTVGDLLPIAGGLQPAQVAEAAWAHGEGFRVLVAPDPGIRVPADDFTIVLEAAASAAEVVIVHLAKALDEPARASIAAADRVLHVLTLDTDSFRAADRALEALSRLRLAARSGFVVNRAARSEIAPSDVRRVFGVDVLAVFPVDRAVERARVRGRLLGLHLHWRARIPFAPSRVRMRIIMCVLLLAGSLSSTASAGTLRVRTDPNDVAGGARDIRTVSTELSDTQLYVSIEMWGRFFSGGPYIRIYLDTHGTGRWDRLVEVLYGYVRGQGLGWHCLGYGFDGTRPPGNGAMPASRPSARSVACRLPRTWFPDIHRAVRFVVLTDFRYQGRRPSSG